MVDIQELFPKKIISREELQIGTAAGINSLVALNRSGVSAVRLRFEDGGELDLALKTKSEKLIRNGIAIVSGNSLRLKKELMLYKKILGYDNSVKREIAVYERADNELRPLMIEYLGFYRKPRQRQSVMVFGKYSADMPPNTYETAQKSLDAVSRFHKKYYNNPDAARKLKLNSYTPDDYRRSKNCLRLLFNRFPEENLRIFGREKTERINEFIDRIDFYATRVEFRRSFTHNDFCRRNIFIEDGGVRLYDFELACYQNPEHDLIEYLMYEASVFDDDQLLSLIADFRSKLPDTEVGTDNRIYGEILRFNTYEWIANRLSLLRIVGRKFNVGFIDSLLTNADRLSDFVEEYYES